VIRVKTHETEQLARLIAALPPPPWGWVAAAQELPVHRRNLDELLVRAQSDEALRARLIENLESALVESGIAPTPPILEAARAQLRPA
jgi:hypothetical protein